VSTLLALAVFALLVIAEVAYQRRVEVREDLERSFERQRTGKLGADESPLGRL